MTAGEIVAGLEARTISNRAFGHREHLSAAWYYIRRDGVEAGISATVRAIRSFAEHLGHGEKFHLTLTLCWGHLVAAAMRQERGCATPDELIARHSALQNKDLPLRFYSPQALFSEQARQNWVPPDLEPLPR